MEDRNTRLATRKTQLLYDATCGFCTASSKQALRLVPLGTLELVDVNDPKIQARYGITREDAQRAMHLIRPNGRMSEGASAVRDILRLSRWAWPLANFWRIPGFPWLADRVYAWVADHRYFFMGKVEPAAGCENGACKVYLGNSAR